MKTITAKVTFACILALCVLASGVYAVAQDSSDTNITGGGTSGTLPKFTGAHSIGNSIVKQSSGKISVAGAVDATSSSAATNTVFADNEVGINGTGNAVYGQNSSTGQSNTGQGLSNLYSVGVWGDGGSDSNYAIFATADNHSAVIAYDNAENYFTMDVFNEATGGTGYPWEATNGDGAGCSINPTGDLSCTGSKNAVVAVNNAKNWVALAAVESPKNWFEDFGSGQLVGGVGTVNLDSMFSQTVNTGVAYHVFLTPNGDCKGLYVYQKNATSFEVRELGGGTSNVTFDYRITALRKNYENVRFADHSREFPLTNRLGRVSVEEK